VKNSMGFMCMNPINISQIKHKYYRMKGCYDKIMNGCYDKIVYKIFNSSHGNDAPLRPPQNLEWLEPYGRQSVGDSRSATLRPIFVAGWSLEGSFFCCWRASCPRSVAVRPK
jgi:hypothetical protein